MLRRLFDFNKTIKHVPYKELKAQHDRERKRSDLFFQVILWGSVIAFAVIFIAQYLPK